MRWFSPPRKDTTQMIPAVRDKCAGIDVGKKIIAVTVMTGPAMDEPKVETRMFGTFVRDLEQMRAWVVDEQGCTDAAMESTGSYWIPVYNILEGSIQVTLANALHVKGLKGHKTDVEDSIWLAHLHRHGLIKASFVPDRPIRELRELTRRRKRLLGAAASERNRIQKILECANVKLGSVLSNVFGISGQEMLHALLCNQAGPEQIAELAKGRLRVKMTEIAAAVDGHLMSEQQRVLVRQAAKHVEYLEGDVEKLDAQIAEKIQPYRQQFDLLLTVPGVKEITAAVILAEIGPDMRQFGSHRRLCSWAGVCPGNHLSAGKRKGSKINRGNPWLMGALIEASWGAVAKQGTVFKKRFYRHMARMGRKKAVVAEARSLLVAIFHVLNDGVPYRAPDEGAIGERERQHLIAHHRRCLQRLGIVVPEACMTAAPSGAKKKKARASAPVEAPPLPACVGVGESAQIPPLPSSLNQGKKSRAKATPASQRQDCPHPGADPARPPKAARTAVSGAAANSAPKMPRMRRGKLGIRAR